MGRTVRGRRIFLAAAIAALAVGTAALASSGAVPVALKLASGSDQLDVGQSTKLTATAKLPKGAHLLIQAFPTARKPMKVAECLRSPCTASFKDSQEETVAFQASAIKRAGGKVTTLGKSKRVEVFWSEPVPEEPPTPPAPPPAAAPGHYEGTIGNARAFLRFDVGADGLTMTNLDTGEIDESCDPPTITFWFTNTGGPGPFSIAADGSFTIGGSGTFDLDGSPAQYTIKFTGKVTGTSASGILHVDTSLSLKGEGFSCSSGDQPWTATKTG